MHRVTRLFGPAVIVAFTFAAISPATASASEPTKILPEPTAGAPLTATATQAESHFLTVGGLEVKCKKGSGSESWTSANSGTGSMLFTECKGPLSTVCTGEGDPEGLIAVKGEVHFWLALLMTGTKEKEATELAGALVLLLESAGAKFTCVNKTKTIEDKIVVRGCTAAQVLSASLNKLVSEAKEEFAEWSSGETRILKVLPQEKTEEINCLPTTSTNGGAEELTALSGAFTTGTFKKGGSSLTIELMNSGGGGGAESTTLSTKLSGEGKESEEITILEGAKAKDKATLSGKNASKATGKVTYKVYSEKECKTPVVTVGEVTVSGESVPASSEEELEGGKAYYWQAHYGGDSNNTESTSACTEVLNVEAKTSLSLKLSGEGSEGEEITISAGSAAEGKATLSGTNFSTAGGKAVYDVYSDNKCEHLVTAAGEVAVGSGKIPVSSEEELEGDETYYWQATYKGDALHQESNSACGKAVLNVNPVCALPYCEPTITPGVELKVKVVGGEKLCTAGPIMKSGAELLLLTAGHCFAKQGSTTEEVTSKYPGGAKPEKRIGSTGTATFNTEYDLGEVKIENGEWLVAGSAPPVLVEWGLTPKLTMVTGKAANSRKEPTCFTGAKSGVHCGEILRTGAIGPNNVESVVETTADGVAGDSGSPEYAPGGSALIQGVYLGGGAITSSGGGDLTVNSNAVTNFPLGAPGNTACEKIAQRKEWWSTVPIEGEWIPANTTVLGCKEVGAPPTSTTIEMSLKATKTAEVEVTFGRKVLGWFEPMSQIEAKYPGQTLLVK